MFIMESRLVNIFHETVSAIRLHDISSNEAKYKQPFVQQKKMAFVAYQLFVQL